MLRSDFPLRVEVLELLKVFQALEASSAARRPFLSCFLSCEVSSPHLWHLLLHPALLLLFGMQVLLSSACLKKRLAFPFSLVSWTHTHTHTHTHIHTHTCLMYCSSILGARGEHMLLHWLASCCTIIRSAKAPLRQGKSRSSSRRSEINTAGTDGIM